ncbi:erythromycin esterase [Actinoplanes ianthinogenes]|uniref:Erythromycin esterase n=1 Tax=Actinoplanes ianthinogenes TaxID=122358 RepID=A0ABM7M930_9ACTN|nr:erythromycin esterase family protein [Actinoplanes ianthinogenes]BCJ48158.1 erythromycin esterase [Actinoplanes ianthinogenes]GGR06852.1 erythromycin esterase [Actinoplanes ianthinogenes]
MTIGLDDFDALRKLLGDAQVVGIGESAHNVREYQQVRQHLVRFLVEELDFSVLALESGFSEGLRGDRWVRGQDDDDLAVIAEQGLTYGFGRTAETRELLTWLRSRGDIGFAGLDLPADLGSLLPAVEGVARYLAEVDPAAIHQINDIFAYARSWARPFTMAAFSAYRETAAADRDALTLLLGELATRMDALRPLYERRGGGPGFATAGHELRLAVLLDQMLRAQVAAAGGSGIHAAVNVRDAAMAETVRHLRRDGRKVVISAANTHLQRIPIMLGGTFEVPVLGSHLVAELGEAYTCIGVSAVSGRTPTRRPAPGTESGVEVRTVDLAPPAPGSVEAFLPVGTSVQVTDLRPLRGAPDGPQRFRNLDGYVDLPVADAFDLIAMVPHLT